MTRSGSQYLVGQYVSASELNYACTESRITRSVLSKVSNFSPLNSTLTQSRIVFEIKYL